MAKTKIQPHHDPTENNWEIEPEPAPETRTKAPNGGFLSYAVFPPEKMEKPLKNTLDDAIARAIYKASDNGVDLLPNEVIDWGVFPDRVTVIFRNGMKIIV